MRRTSSQWLSRQRSRVTCGFSIYFHHLGPDALCPWDTIGSHGVKNFTLSKKADSDRKYFMLQRTAILKLTRITC
ncbi:hypothetical protein VNO80_13076 [Phaseolus coccineus]|uniref:Uncharacterized protein n=1 Tax=Phaseolus coccineus TaxID=3886 RepID=A0AAN9N160_PHACN